MGSQEPNVSQPCLAESFALRTNGSFAETGPDICAMEELAANSARAGANIIVLPHMLGLARQEESLDPDAGAPANRAHRRAVRDDIEILGHQRFRLAHRRAEIERRALAEIGAPVERDRDDRVASAAISRRAWSGPLKQMTCPGGILTSLSPSLSPTTSRRDASSTSFLTGGPVRASCTPYSRRAGDFSPRSAR
nr:hypothetical protein BDOA9_0138910 [Bradyrhizobium sp. DOA9]